ncbi:NrtA/SsuA/CpmA family ABC transporter substrate-binding protein [Azospirillum griseum]|uniref:Transporter substrate-binding domain-containing protein n=1 Tax=Azospirillum griseum TaxID=2496639 RepID=A0A3S0HWF5_9PROT|nr:NrtA/SsuA/CpmA family ABC transporter substrate-binding protein [Azospirillum griseum]RTR18646.1 transporter substrate-binding domain-containing protein [Azospirillum griseum]
MTDFPPSTRRRFLASSLAGAGALAGLSSFPSAFAADGRKTDTLRLTWGFTGLTFIAKERGELEKTLAKDGIKVEWIGPFPNHAPTLQAVTGGTADVSFGGSTTPALAAIIAGSPLVFTQFLVYDPRTTSIIAKPDSGIRTVKDLVGKSVAVNRSGLGEFLLVAALEKHGIDRSKVNVVYLNPPDAAPALASGKVDAWSMWSPGVDIARVEHNATDVFLEGRDLDFQIDFTSYLTRRRFAEDNPSLIRAFNAALKIEADWATANTKEAEHIAQAKAGYRDEVRDHLISLKRRYTLYPVTDQSFVTELQKATEWLVARKVLPEAVTVADHLARV